VALVLQVLQDFDRLLAQAKGSAELHNRITVFAVKMDLAPLPLGLYLTEILRSGLE
jgi:hypothetical protein